MPKHFVVLLILTLFFVCFGTHRSGLLFQTCDRDSSPISCWQNSGVCNQDPPSRSLQPGMAVRDDTIGSLIANQMLWRIPGLDTLSFGFNTFTGENAKVPVFLFCYPTNSSQTTRLQDTYRGNTYVLPDEVYVTASPTCSYSMETQTYSSAQQYAASMMQSTSLSGSVEASYSGWGFSASAKASFSSEKTVSAAYSVQQKKGGELSVTQVSCETSKVKLDDNISSFHPHFVQDLYQVDLNNVNKFFDKYGTHFITDATLGGKLSQVSVTASNYLNQNSKTSVKEKSQASFSASASGWGISASASGAYSASYDGNQESQMEYESKSSKSNIISYGGAAGSFGPSKDSSSAGDWGSWAKTIDLLPVPITYHLRPIQSVIPTQWLNHQGLNVSGILFNSSKVYFQKKQLELLLKDNGGLDKFVFTIKMKPGDSSTFSGPYGFVLPGQNPSFFYEKIQVPLNQSTSEMRPVLKPIWFDAGSNYAIEYNGQILPDNWDGQFQVCMDTGILGFSIGGKPLSSWGVQELTISDSLNGKYYWYDLSKPFGSEQCQTITPTPLNNYLSVSFFVKDLNGGRTTNLIHIRFVGTGGVYDAYVPSTDFRTAGAESGSVYTKVFTTPSIGYLLSVSMNIIAPYATTPGTAIIPLTYNISGETFTALHTYNGNTYGFSSCCRHSQTLTIFDSVMFGLQLI